MHLTVKCSAKLITKQKGIADKSLIMSSKIMARVKRDVKILNIKLGRGSHEQLEKFCDESGLTKITAVEKNLYRFFEEYFKRPKDGRTLF